jgi:hypothetical protein
MNDGEGSGVAPTDALSIYDRLVPNRGAILIPTRDGEQGRFNFKCNQGATYGMTQLLYSDAIVGFLTEFAKTDDIAAAIRDHQVVVVAGETGSGKTTQLPKICLELGRGRARRDRPHPAAPDRRAHGRRADRRGAGHPLGEAVGYKVRFTDQVGDDTLVKLMTDGILLAEIQRDRLLRRYDTIIIDEAHERSLNIDFLLGYLKRSCCRAGPTSS